MNNLNKILIGLILIVAALGAYFYFRESSPQASNQPNNENNQMQNEPEVTAPETAVAVVETNKGTFEVTLDGKAAPRTVANFIKLANEGFYEGLIFHRVVQQPGFNLIQGGDPSGDGTGGPGYTVPAEIGLKHTRGAIATARTGDQVNPTKASSGSQFYIVLEDIPFLDNNYTVFGYVTNGVEVADEIGKVETDPADKPLTPVTINKITIKE